MSNPIQVIQVPGIGEELQKAVGPLIDVYQKRRQLELQEQELKLRQQEFKQRQEEAQAKEAQLGQTGEALRAMLIAQDSQQFPAASFPAPIGLGEALTPPGATFTGVGPIAQAVMNAPAAAIPAAVQLSPDIRRQILEQRATREADQVLATEVAKIKDPQQREAFQSFISLKRGGIDLPVAVQQTLFPSLYAQGVDPEIMNAALRYGVAGGLSWGQVRSLFKLPKNELLSDDFKFPVTLQRNQKQMTAEMHYTSMARNGPLIDKLVDETGGITALAQIKRAFDATQASSGGVTGFFANIGAMVLNGVLSPKQQQLVQAQFAWTNSYRYLVSGQQTSDREFMVILNTVAEGAGDSPEVKAQKRAFRQVMTEAARRLATGQTQPTTAADEVLQQAKALGFPPELIQVLQQQKEDATKFQAQGGPPLLTRDPEDAQSEAARQLILQMIMTGGKP